jgi:signal transduction histidine kinase
MASVLIVDDERHVRLLIEQTPEELADEGVERVSHEHPTPLTSVIGFTRLIGRRLPGIVFPLTRTNDPKVARAMRQVTGDRGIMVAEGERLTATIDDVLDLVRSRQAASTGRCDR